MTIRKLMCPRPFIRPRPFLEGADESGVSSAPSGTRGCGTPSLGPSGGHVSALLPRRCRRKWRFIVTFRCPRLWVPVRRPFWRPCLRAPSKKVPTKAVFHRHLPVPAVVGPRPKALLAAMSPRSFQEGADESGVSSAPSDILS